MRVAKAKECGEGEIEGVEGQIEGGVGNIEGGEGI